MFAGLPVQLCSADHEEIGERREIGHFQHGDVGCQVIFQFVDDQVCEFK